MTAAKRVFDVALSAAGLVVVFPIVVVAAFAIYAEDGAPIFFRQQRVGEHGKHFSMLKLRTMRNAQSADQVPLTVGGDSRITRVGRILRKFKIDELPQLVNVLIGEMTLVGPRPEVPRYVAHYSPAQAAVLALRPGITDPASIKYANESDLLAGVANPESHYIDAIMPDKIRINLEYAERATVWSDFGVVLATLRRIAG